MRKGGGASRCRHMTAIVALEPNGMFNLIRHCFCFINVLLCENW